MKTPSLVTPHVGRRHHLVTFDIDGDDLSASESVFERSLGLGNRLFSRLSFPDAIRHDEHRSYKYIARPVATKDLTSSCTHEIECSAELKKEAILSTWVSFSKRGAAHLKISGHATTDFRGRVVYVRRMPAGFLRDNQWFGRILCNSAHWGGFPPRL